MAFWDNTMIFWDGWTKSRLVLDGWTSGRLQTSCWFSFCCLLVTKNQTKWKRERKERGWINTCVRWWVVSHILSIFNNIINIPSIKSRAQAKILLNSGYFFMFELDIWVWKDPWWSLDKSSYKRTTTLFIAPCL